MSEYYKLPDYPSKQDWKSHDAVEWYLAAEQLDTFLQENHPDLVKGQHVFDLLLRRVMRRITVGNPAEYDAVIEVVEDFVIDPRTSHHKVKEVQDD